jgi:malate dehydrogenase
MIQKVQGFLPPNDGGKTAFKDADIIVIPAGIPRMFLVENCV